MRYALKPPTIISIKKTIDTQREIIRERLATICLLKSMNKLLNIRMSHKSSIFFWKNGMESLVYFKLSFYLCNAFPKG